LKFGVAPSFSECDPTNVASTSITTAPSSSPNGRRRPHTLSRAAARAARIRAIAAIGSAAKVSISRLIVGSEATAPNNCG
jgi:hypothetical protein